MQHLTIGALLFCIVNLAGAAEAYANPGKKYQKTSELCGSAARAQEGRDAIPRHLLSAIAQAESGRWYKEKQANFAWPWTVTTGGTGKYFETKIEAVAAVEFLRTNGVRNIDVGCMQINLAAHPNAFETIDHAFEPIANVAYGAEYLKIMHQRTGNWLKAAGNYHSMTTHLSDKYQTKISRIWNKLLRTEKTMKKIVKVKPIANFSPQYPKPTIDYARLNKLNLKFREGLSRPAKAATHDPLRRRANKRLEQIAAWRRSQSRGENLNVLANIRQAEHAKRRKRELAAVRKGDRQVVFTKRRLKQLNSWRNRRNMGIKDN